MGKGRLEAFSDGVIAIALTIMVLELKAPSGTDLAALRPLLPTFLAYVLSFVYLGIYWTNHHHLLGTVRRVTGGILWANLHLLFWLSMVPVGTRWMGGAELAALPTAVYAVNLFMAGFAYSILQGQIIRAEGPDAVLTRAIGRDLKGKASVGLYLLATLAAFFDPRISQAIFVLIALAWLVPDRRIERVLVED